MNISKLFTRFHRLFLRKKTSTNSKSTQSLNIQALTATHFKEHCYWGKGMMNKRIILVTPRRCYTVPAGVPGAGAGRGGGSGGSVRESGGGLGRYGAAQEEGYFIKKQREQLANIKKKMDKEPQHTEESQPPKE